MGEAQVTVQDQATMTLAPLRTTIKVPIQANITETRADTHVVVIVLKGTMTDIIKSILMEHAQGMAEMGPEPVSEFTGGQATLSTPVSQFPAGILTIAERQAATRAMKQAADNGIKDLVINTDSKFLIKSATEWMPGWKQAGWRLASGGPVKNEQDFKELDRAQSKLNVKWRHVESHQGVQGNEEADRLAKAGASK